MALRWEELANDLGLGLDRNNPGKNLNAFLLESTAVWGDVHTIFGRVEHAAKDEPFTPAGGGLATSSTLDSQTFKVNQLTVGYIYDIRIAQHLKLGFGGLGSLYALPSELTPYYGREPISFMVFVRLKIM